MRVQLTAIICEGNPKKWYSGQEKMHYGRGKNREGKSQRNSFKTNSGNPEQ